MRSFLKNAFLKRIKKPEDPDVDEQLENLEVDPEFYRVGLTLDERKELVERLL